MNPILIAGPAVEPVMVAEMRAFLRLDDAAEDELVAVLVKTARHRVETVSGRRLIAQTWRLGLERRPEDGVAVLPLSPLLASRNFASSLPMERRRSWHRRSTASTPCWTGSRSRYRGTAP